LARLKLFAQARDSAGTGEAQVEGASVGEVLDAAAERFGERFASVVGISAVWLNGEPASRDLPVTSADEVAVLPPVSGG
jgi:molybdopterin synthase sulfur carrier subunit